MRLMSVALTEPAVRRREKTVTRRAGWKVIKPGDRVMLCRKVMGRRKGDPLVRIVPVEIVSTRWERLDEITEADVRLEGLGHMTPGEFVEFFTASHKGVHPDSLVHRIEWKYRDVECWACDGAGVHPDGDPDAEPDEPDGDPFDEYLDPPVIECSNCAGAGVIPDPALMPEPDEVES